MTRNIKALGLMAIAALAMSAMFAVSAQAEEFTAGATPDTHTQTEIVGTQYGSAGENFLSSFGETVSCSSATYTGTDADGTASSITLNASYSGCASGEGLPATVTMGGCGYTFNTPTSIGANQWTGSAALHCTSGTVQVHIYAGASHGFTLCTLSVPAQSNLDHVIYTGVKNGKDHLTAEATVSKITVHETGLCGSKSTTDGVLNTKVTVKAYKDDGTTNTQHDLWIN